ncbi:positive regulation of cristae formation [Desmophyllum pertusum]|uniref:Positive regulation of cristae formation n=1 Tax=Desmophyllum pertusum TaxID=174260 RepID=A0A9X0CGS1_9CNID|nr:positive regulation of cristae formation [Desmophyllum pertusum]
MSRKKEQFKELHQWIQEALWNTNMFAQYQEDVEQPSSLAQLKLKDFEVGERLGESSSNSAVYAAKYMGREFAVKMLFNFGARSQSSSLYREFAKEYQVLSVGKQQNTSEAGDASYTSLPPHPNISPVLHAFADDVPCLPDAITSYPAALPMTMEALPGIAPCF